MFFVVLGFIFLSQRFNQAIIYVLGFFLERNKTKIVLSFMLSPTHSQIKWDNKKLDICINQ